MSFIVVRYKLLSIFFKLKLGWVYEYYIQYYNNFTKFRIICWQNKQIKSQFQNKHSLKIMLREIIMNLEGFVKSFGHQGIIKCNKMSGIFFAHRVCIIFHIII